MPTPGPQEARRIVEELNAEQRHEVVRALERLALGSDDEREMELMSLVWRSASPATTQALQKAGVSLTVAETLTMFRQHPGAVSAVSRASGQGTQAEAAVQELRSYARPWLRHPIPDEGVPTADSIAALAVESPLHGSDSNAGGEAVSSSSKRHASSEGPIRSPSRQERPPRPQARAYSSSAAVVFELDTLRGLEEQPVRHTVAIEAAPGRGGEGYDWGDKIIFQCTLRELPQVVACLMGWTHELEFKGHGSALDKRLLMRHQGDSVYLKLMQGRRAVSLPMPVDDLYAIVLVCLRALAANDPDLPVPSLLEVIKQLAQARADSGLR